MKSLREQVRSVLEELSWIFLEITGCPVRSRSRCRIILYYGGEKIEFRPRLPRRAKIPPYERLRNLSLSLIGGGGGNGTQRKAILMEEAFFSPVEALIVAFLAEKGPAKAAMVVHHLQQKGEASESKVKYLLANLVDRTVLRIQTGGGYDVTQDVYASAARATLKRLESQGNSTEPAPAPPA